MATVEPDWVIHTAALTDVDRCETEPALAREVNLVTVVNLVAACRKVSAGLVQMSTDYVFDGRDGPYSEEDVPRPLSHYGRLKLESEQRVLENLSQAFVLRTLWLYGHAPGVRRNLVTWPLEAFAADRELHIVDDQWGNPTAVDDAARALIDLCRGNGSGLFHMGGADFMTRFELVGRLAQVFGFREARIKAVRTAAKGQAAPRPPRSGLKSDKLTEKLGRPTAGFVEGLQRKRSQPGFTAEFHDVLTHVTG